MTDPIPLETSVPCWLSGWRARSVSLLALAAVALLTASCGPVRLVATSNIPTPLVVKIPVAVALSVPKDFSEYVHKEERSGTDWEINLGKAQSEGLTRLLTAMFDRVITVDGVNAGSQTGQNVRAILEPSVEEYAFVTPRDAGSPFYAVSIKYRLNIYTPDGHLADSWGFTGYGTAPSQGLSSSDPLNQATSLALRDAGAKLAVEFREQAIVRGLVSETAPQTPLSTKDAAPPVVTATPESAPDTPQKPWPEPPPASETSSSSSSPAKPAETPAASESTSKPQAESSAPASSPSAPASSLPASASNQAKPAEPASEGSVPTKEAAEQPKPQ